MRIWPAGARSTGCGCTPHSPAPRGETGSAAAPLLRTAGDLLLGGFLGGLPWPGSSSEAVCSRSSFRGSFVSGWVMAGSPSVSRSRPGRGARLPVSRTRPGSGHPRASGVRSAAAAPAPRTSPLCPGRPFGIRPIRCVRSLRRLPVPRPGSVGERARERQVDAGCSRQATGRTRSGCRASTLRLSALAIGPWDKRNVGGLRPPRPSRLRLIGCGTPLPLRGFSD